MRHNEEYPRPLLERETWMNLNGKWDFAFDDADRGEAEGWGRGFAAQRSIEVPFSYETQRSGIGDGAQHPVLWYQRTVTLAAPLAAGRCLRLHLEGADWRVKMWADGVPAGEHRGGYTRASFTLPLPAGTQSFQLVLRLEDSLSPLQARGKQRFKPESWGCWYVQTSGLWKTVWLEEVSEYALASLRIRPQEDGSVVLTPRFLTGALPQGIAPQEGLTLQEGSELYKGLSLCGRIRAGEEAVASFMQEIGKPEGETACEDSAKNPGSPEGDIIVPAFTDTPHVWTPEDPFLYTLECEVIHRGEVIDRVLSYFAFRRVSVGPEGFAVSGKPVYLCMVLNQGYWPESGLTPPSLDAMKEDLAIARRYGYNAMRLHQKTEDERLHALCDREGFLLWNEMAAAYEYMPEAAADFTEEWLDVVAQYEGHPSVIAWVPFNESWGIPQVAHDPEQQRFVRQLVAQTKDYDPTRPVISNDGWEHVASDVLTVHDYREWGHELLENHGDADAAVLAGEKSFSWYGQKLLAEGTSYEGQPLILSEYGGIAFETDEGWGYGAQVKDEEAYLVRFLSLQEAAVALPQFRGVCYTQLTDVEQERNGLVTAGRLDKLSPLGIRRIRESNQILRGTVPED